MRHIPQILIVFLAALGLALPGCGSGGSSGSSGGGGATTTAAVDSNAPTFGGACSISTAGGAAILLDWEAGDDDTSGSTLTYAVYLAATSEGQDFAAPVLTTASTGAVLTSANSPLIAVGQRVFAVVRALDAAGNGDTNVVELACTPVAPANVAFVSSTAGGAGTLGDASDPFLTVQDGVTAVEGAGGGVVLVDADASGTTYVGETSLAATVSSIGLYGGFARFSTLPGGATGEQILATRNVSGFETRLSGDNAVMVNTDLIDIANGHSITDVDGFTFRDLYNGNTVAVTGTLHFTRGSHHVTGTGTAFTADLSTGQRLIATDSGFAATIEALRSDTDLVLDQAWPGETGSTTVLRSTIVNPGFAISTTDVRLQVSCCRLRGGARLQMASLAASTGSELRLVGNEIRDEGATVVNATSSLVMLGLRIQNNVVYHRDDLFEGTLQFPASSNVAIRATNNVTYDAGSLLDTDFEPVDPSNGASVHVLIEHNECRAASDSEIDMDDAGAVGENGSLTILCRDNFIAGGDDTTIDLDIVDTLSGPYAGVATSVVLERNVQFAADSTLVDVSFGTSANQTASFLMRDCHFGPGEDDVLEFDDSFVATADAHDGGVIRLHVLRNVSTGGADTLLDTSCGAPQNGRVELLIMENTHRNGDDVGLDVDLDSTQGTTSATYDFPEAVSVVTIFNNDIQAGSDEEGLYLQDTRGVAANGVAYWWIAQNFGQADGDASNGAFEIDARARFGHWRFERNIGVGLGQDDSEVGFYLDTDAQDLFVDVVFQNNMATASFGGGFQQADVGPWGQWINNTAAFTGSEDGEHGAFSFDETSRQLGDNQNFLLNCIGSHSGGQDVDHLDGMFSNWSLVHRALGAPGFQNVIGDPDYATTFTDFSFPGLVDDYATLYTLSSTSPAVDAGHPATRYNDVDGSRNDMGAYGGPAAGTLGYTAAGTALPLAFVGMAPAADLFTGASLPVNTQVLHFGFNQPVDETTVAANLVVANDGVAVPGTFAVAGGGHLVTFTPTTVLNPTSGQIVSVTMNTGLLATAGTALDRAQTYRFAVAGTPTAEIEANDDGVAGVTAADMAAAQPLTIGTGNTAFEVTGVFSSVDDVDVFAVTLTEGHRLMATVLQSRLVGGSADEVALSVYDAQGRRVRMGRQRSFDGGPGSGDPYLDWIVESTGTWYIVVDLASGAGASPYQLQAVVDTLD